MIIPQKKFETGGLSGERVVRVVVNGEVTSFVKIQKNRVRGLGRGVGGRVLGGQRRCERRSEVFVKNQKNILGVGVGSGGSGCGVRVNVNEELKFW